MSQENKKLLFQHQVLQARLDIRDFFLRTTVREVYENIGQVLSLVRMQLSFVEPGFDHVPKEKINTSGDLVGQSIRDLRSMCRSFYPDDEIIENAGFVEGLKNTIKILELGCGDGQVKTSGTPKEATAGLMLIVFKILLEIFTSIKENDEEFIACSVNHTGSHIIFSIRYRGAFKDLQTAQTNKNIDPNLSIEERVKLVGGDVKFENLDNQTSNIHLLIPYNLDIYEN